MFPATEVEQHERNNVAGVWFPQPNRLQTGAITKLLLFLKLR